MSAEEMKGEDAAYANGHQAGRKERQPEIDALKAEVALFRESVERLHGLRGLLGYVQNGTSTTVTLSQDDATYDFDVKVGKRSYYNRSFTQAIDAAIKENENDD